MGKHFEISAGERKRVLWLYSSSMSGNIRFTAEGTNGDTPEGKVELVISRWFKTVHQDHPLLPGNVFDKGFADWNYKIYVTPQNDCSIQFETRHFRFETMWVAFAVVLLLGILAPVIMMIISNSGP